MGYGEDGADPDTVAKVSRRRFLAAGSTAAAVGFAGCSSVTEQEFEATPIRLPEQAQENLVVVETAAEPTTITREPGVGGIEGKVTITSHGATNRRGPLRGHPTLIEKYLGRVNDTEGAGAAAVATASDLGINEVTFDLEGADYAPLPGDQVSIVAPAGARSDSETKPEVGAPISGPFLLGWMTDVPDGTSFLPEATTFAIDAKAFFPGLVYDGVQTPGDFNYDPMREWMPAGSPAPRPDFLSEGTVVVVLGDYSPEEVFGISAEEMPGERLGEGESFTGNNPFLVTGPSSTFTYGPLENGLIFDPDSGYPTWVGGATYGVGVLSTPAGKVAGQSVNPISGMSLEELLTSDQARGLLKQAGATDADEVEWLAGPAPVAEITLGPSLDEGMPDSTTILDEETDLKSFLGVVSGEDGPWGVGIHMARVEHERDGGTDVVVSASTHRWPVGGADGGYGGEWLDSRSERFTGILGSIITEARILTAAVNQQLAPGTVIQ